LKGLIAMPKVKVNDIQMYYDVKGKGFPLLMIMDLGNNLELWNPRLIEGLSKNFKLVLFDNRGAGRTDISDREYTMRLFADDAAGLMNTLGIGRAHVLGLSMGGMIAQELVLNHAEKVSKVVLCSTSSQWSGGSKFVQASRNLPETPSAVPSTMSLEELSNYSRTLLALVCTEDFIESNLDFVEFFAQKTLMYPTSKTAYSRQLNAQRKFNDYERLRLIEAPTLVLHGRKDVLIHPENAAILARAIPNAQLVYFEKSAHGLAEEMNEVIHVITRFLL
jgi:pimeloyl-ACP methyl ester carboxylesterase